MRLSVEKLAAVAENNPVHRDTCLMWNTYRAMGSHQDSDPGEPYHVDTLTPFLYS